MYCGHHKPDYAHNDVWCGWGALHPVDEICIFTDGSYDADSNTSAWAMSILNEWLYDHSSDVPTNGKLLTPAHVRRAYLMGANIVCTNGIYPAELQAIARALAMFPLSHRLHIYSDSMASIKAIQTYRSQTNERKRLRMSARPLLQLIDNLISRRKAACRSARLILEFTHVHAHTTHQDPVSVGNRIADYQANLSRKQPKVTCPPGLAELPLRECEYHMALVCKSDDKLVIDDIRRSALKQLHNTSMNHWHDRHQVHQGRFAHEGILHLSRIILRSGSSSSLQATLIQVATNSIHQHWQVDPSAKSGQSVQALRCAPCRDDMSIDHLSVCTQHAASKFRQQLKKNIIDILMTIASSDGRRLLTRCSPFDLDYVLTLLCPVLLSAPGPAAFPVDHQQHLHYTRCLIGAFTDREATVILLESLDKFYSTLKSSP